MKARIRLILVVLALVVAPLSASLSGSALMAMPVATPAAAGCDHDCGCSGPAHGTQRCEACPLSCTQHAVPPQIPGVALHSPAADALIAPHPHGDIAAATAWPPPLPPPRS